MNRVDKQLRYLEIGFGDGCAIEYVLNKKNVIGVEGVDISETMKQNAWHYLNSKQCNMDNIRLHVGNVERMNHIESESVDVVFHSNCVHFWDNLDKGLAEIHRVIKSEGEMVSNTSFEGIGTLLNHRTIFKNTNENEYVQKLKQIGFTDISIKRGFKYKI